MFPLSLSPPLCLSVCLSLSQVAIFAVTLLLQQMKRPHKKIAMDIEKLCKL